MLILSIFAIRDTADPPSDHDQTQTQGPSSDEDDDAVFMRPTPHRRRVDAFFFTTQQEEQLVEFYKVIGVKCRVTSLYSLLLHIIHVHLRL